GGGTAAPPPELHEPADWHPSSPLSCRQDSGASDSGHMPPSPGRAAALTSELRAEVERRLAASAPAGARLGALERRAAAAKPGALGRGGRGWDADEAFRGAADAAHGGGASGRLADIFDELLASDQARRMAAI
ncbi:hypothetical protein MNEG_16155, partial [Monoraphidium neglectum]